MQCGTSPHGLRRTDFAVRDTRLPDPPSQVQTAGQDAGILACNRFQPSMPDSWSPCPPSLISWCRAHPGYPGGRFGGSNGAGAHDMPGRWSATCGVAPLRVHGAPCRARRSRSRSERDARQPEPRTRRAAAAPHRASMPACGVAKRCHAQPFPRRRDRSLYACACPARHPAEMPAGEDAPAPTNSANAGPHTCRPAHTRTGRAGTLMASHRTVAAVPIPSRH